MRTFLIGNLSSYVTFLFNTPQAIMGHLYNFTALSGATDYLTDMDTDITLLGNTYSATGLRIDGPRRKISVGLEVDEQEMSFYALPTDTLFGSTFITAVEEGLLDGCLISRVRVVWQLATGNVFDDIQQTPVAAFTMFTGYASEVQTAGKTTVKMKVKSPLVKLETNMPRNYYQPGCLWTLFDAGCTLNKASFAVSGTAGPGGDKLTIPVSGGIAVPTGADGIANYAQGRLLFTSGVNSGLLTLIDTNDAANLVLSYPLHADITAGDTFTYYPGCSKSFNTCDLKFANKANFRGFDKVPPVMVSI